MRGLLALVAAAVAASLAAAAPGGQSTPGGTIRGRIVLAGKAPGNPMIRMGVDPKCSELTAGRRVFQETALVAPDGSVQNVFLRLEGSFPAVAVPQQPVVIDQRSCMYGPHVVGLRLGQTLRVRNDDDLLHNVHSSSAIGNSFNVGQPKAGLFHDFKPAREEVMLKLGCDVHRWMTAYVGVVAHPYFAVSDAAGHFEISGVPPGTYPIRIWHERFGEMSKTVTIRRGAVTTVDFTYVQ